MKKLSGTDSILEAFEGVSSEEWLAKIHEDLRGADVSDMSWKFDDDLTISPFVHADDIGTAVSDIDFRPQWEIAEEFLVADEAEANRDVLEALNCGCEVIMLKVSGIPNWSRLLSGINLEMIKTYVIPVDEELTQTLIASLGDYISQLTEVPKSTLVHVRGDKNVIGGPAHIQAGRTVVENLAMTIHLGIRRIHEQNDLDQLECVVDIGDAYFVEIARLRALRILWTNALAALGLSRPSLFVEGRFSEQDMTDNLHKNMIAAGAKALSAISGGVDRLIIAPSGLPNNSFHRRISRNIHHILRYESKLDVIEDPVKGSYYIEALTKQMVERAWIKLVDLQN